MQVLDWKRFKPGQSLQAGLFWVAEQIPHLIEAADMTETLAWGYWPSYNVPYFPEVLSLAGVFVLSCWRGRLHGEKSYDSSLCRCESCPVIGGTRRSIYQLGDNVNYSKHAAVHLAGDADLDAP